MQNKTVVLGVTGGIAAYKSADIVSRLKKKGYDVFCNSHQAWPKIYN